MAQDPHFSQYHAAPLTLNPAMTGYHDGSFRICGNYRQQWLSLGSPYVTGTISFDSKLFEAKMDNDVLAFGVMGLYDQSLNSAFKSTNISASLAYHKALDGEGNNNLGIGFQFTYASRSINASQLNFANQFNGTGFDNTLPSNESFGNLQQNYPDLHAGILYSFKNELTQAYFGASMYHITGPNISFLKGETYRLPQRYTIHGGSKFIIGENKNELFISGQYMRQGGVSDKIVGIAYGINGNSQTMVYGGLWYRLKDAIIPFIGLTFGNFQLGISYDVMASDLKNYNPKNGSYELSLSFLGSKNSHANTKYLQCPF